MSPICAPAIANELIATALIKGGVFRLAWLRELGFGQEIADEIASQCFNTEVSNFSGDWRAILSDHTVTGRTILRISGALDVYSVPHVDIAQAVIKMISYGQFDVDAKRDQALGVAVGELFTSSLPRDLIEAICEYVGAMCVSGKIDFNSAERYIPLTDREQDLLSLLLLRDGGQAPTSWLSRRLAHRPSRTQVDYNFIPSIPFVLKAQKCPVRLLGKDLIEQDLGRSSEETFVCLRYSPCGNRVALEYRVNEEAVEGNSFNVRPEWKHLVDGEFIEINTGKTLKYNMQGKDARKFVGVGVVVRKRYPDYETGQSAFVIIDRVERLAAVEVGDWYSPSFNARIKDFLENGFVTHQNDDQYFPVAA